MAVYFFRLNHEIYSMLNAPLVHANHRPIEPTIYRLYINHALRSPRPSGSSSFLIFCLLTAFSLFSRRRYAMLAIAMTTVQTDMAINVIVAAV